MAFVLDKDLILIYSSYSQENAKGTREIVSISQSEEARLLKIVQSEINSFIKKMYQILYG